AHVLPRSVPSARRVHHLPVGGRRGVRAGGQEHRQRPRDPEEPRRRSQRDEELRRRRHHPADLLRVGEPRPAALPPVAPQLQRSVEDNVRLELLLMIASANWGLLPGYTVIGITLGGIYALAAIGLVLIYRVSGVLNFAQGAVSMFSAFVAYQVSTVMGAPPLVGLLAAIVVGGALGYVIERFTIRPLAGRPALNTVVVPI